VVGGYIDQGPTYDYKFVYFLAVENKISNREKETNHLQRKVRVYYKQYYEQNDTQIIAVVRP
jgi:hypothetical protein